MGSHAHACRPSSIAARVLPPCNEPRVEIAGAGEQTTGIEAPTASDEPPGQPVAAAAAPLPADHPPAHPALHATHHGKVGAAATGPPTRMGLRPRIPLPANPVVSGCRTGSVTTLPQRPRQPTPATTRSGGSPGATAGSSSRCVAEAVRRRPDGALRVPAVSGSSGKGWPSGSRVGCGEPRLERSAARPRRAVVEAALV